MEFKRYIPVPLKFLYNSHSLVWVNLVQSSLQFSYNLIYRSKRFRVIPAIEKWIPALRINIGYWSLPEIYHPVLPEMVSSDNTIFSGIQNRKNIKVSQKNDVNRQPILMAQPVDEAISSGSKKILVDYKDSISFSQWKDVLNTTPRTIDLKRVTDTDPAVPEFPDKKRKINYKIRLTRQVERPGNINPNENDAKTDELKFLPSLKAIPIGTLSGRVTNHSAGIYKKSSYFPFLVLHDEYPTKGIITFEPGEKREFPPVEMKHKPVLPQIQSDNQRIYRDPANPYRYQIRESLIPSLKQFSGTKTADAFPSGYRKTFHFTSANFPDHMQINKIFSESGTDALSNLVKYNYFKDEFVEEVKDRIIKARPGKSEKYGIDRGKKRQDPQYEGIDAKQEIQEVSTNENRLIKKKYIEKINFKNSSHPLIKSSFLGRVKNFLKIIPVFGRRGSSSSNFITKKEHKFTTHSPLQTIPPFDSRTLTIMLTRHFRRFATPDRIINEAENSLEFAGISTTRLQSDTWIYHQPDWSGYTSKKTRRGFRDKIQRFFKFKSGHEKQTEKTISRVKKTDFETVPLVGESASLDVIIPVDSNVKNESQIENHLVKDRKTFQPLLEESRFVEDWISASNKTADPVHQKVLESFSGLPQNRQAVNSPEENYSVNLPDMMTELNDPPNIRRNRADKKQKLELFFKQYAPEAFPEMGGEEKISGGQKADFLNDQKEGSELECENRQRLLIELSERIWEHLRKKIKQR